MANILRIIALFLSIILMGLIIAVILSPSGPLLRPTLTATFTATPTATFTPTVTPVPTKVTIKFWGVDLDDPGYSIDRALVDEFIQNTGIHVNITPKPRDATEALENLQKLFEQGNPPDVIVLDVIWIGEFAKYLRELTEFEQDSVSIYHPTLLKNSTVDGKLVAIPWFVDFGLLYYRTDLLQKYNGNISPPTTWDELQTMALTIQTGERALGNSDFWGFVWQGAEYEGLTCNATEWIASVGGEIIGEDGTVTINSAETKTALHRAQNWMRAGDNSISPPDVIGYKEGESLKAFQRGDAAFMRYWPTAYTFLNKSVPFDFDVAPLPSNVGTIGGAAIGISNNTDNEEAAIRFVRFMTDYNAQRERANKGSFIPTIPTLWRDPLDASQPSSNPHNSISSFLFLPTLNFVGRPSTVAREKYDEVSTVIYQGVHDILTGSDVDEVVSQLEQQLKTTLGQTPP